MANPQPDKYLKVAIELVEVFCRTDFGVQEWRIIWSIFRKTYGYNKTRDMIPLTQFQIMTGMDRKSVCRTIKTLVFRNVIIASKAPTGNIYGLQKDYDKWVSVVAQQPLVASGSAATGGGGKPHRIGGGKPHRDASGGAATLNKQKTKDKEYLYSIGDEIRGFKKMGWDQQKIKSHFLMREVPESEIDEAMGKNF